MINADQLRAARGLLDWKTSDLAKLSGLTINGINKIERGYVQARRETMDLLQDILEKAGVEFLPGSGVRLKPAGIDILMGREGLQEFFNDVHDYAGKHGGTIMMFGIDETTFIDCIGNEFSQDYLKRMTEVSRVRKDLAVLAIICEGDTNFCASAYNEYRWISKDVFQAVPFYIFGETLAIMDFDTTPGPTIMLLKSRAITNAYRKQFETFWKMAHPASSTSNARTA